MCVYIKLHSYKALHFLMSTAKVQIRCGVGKTDEINVYAFKRTCIWEARGIKYYSFDWAAAAETVTGGKGYFNNDNDDPEYVKFIIILKRLATVSD